MKSQHSNNPAIKPATTVSSMPYR